MSDVANDRYLIAIGQKIEPKIFRTQAEAESAAETLAYHARRETDVYRLSDAGRVSMWHDITAEGIARFTLDRGVLALRPDGSSFLDKPAAVAVGA